MMWKVYTQGCINQTKNVRKMPIHLRRLIWQKAATTQKNVHSAKKKYLKKQKNVLRNV
jgi:hypothetical protein